MSRIISYKKSEVKQKNDVRVISSEGFNFVDKYYDSLKQIDRFHKETETQVYEVISNFQSGFSRALINGNVQSGKTSFTIGLISAALDNKYDYVIYLGGTNTKLLGQSSTRLEKSMKVLFDNKIIDLNKETNLNNVKGAGIINVMKQISNLDLLLKKFKKIPNGKKVLLIDDESDYASVNVAKDKDASEVYADLVALSKVTDCTKYVAITGTPFANILNKTSDLYPEFMINMYTPSDYTGNDVFLKHGRYFKYDKSSEEFDDLQMKIVTMNFLILAAVRRSRGFSRSQLLLNIDVSNDKHKELRSSLVRVLKKINTIANQNYIDAFIKSYWIGKKEFTVEYSFFQDALNDLLSSNGVVILNRNNHGDTEINKRKVEIIIGGYLLSRGITFENLAMEVLLNVGNKKIAMDTLLQKARWFGYRGNLVDFITILMPENAIEAFKKFETVKEILLDNKKWDYVMNAKDIEAIAIELKHFEKINADLSLTWKEDKKDE